MTQTITFVGHAGFVIEAGTTAIWTDPWLISQPFNESWALHPEPVAPAYDRLTHIWISHEHPDHFNIPTLRAIPEDVRARLTMLYQRHYSADVPDFLRGLGFKEVIELVHGNTYTVGDFEVICHQVGHEDATMTFKADGTTVLNLNDCKPSLRGLRSILRDTGPVDVLLDQFSVAGWTGNPDDADRKQREATETLDEMMMHVTEVDATWFVPTASFVRFSHAENVHMMSHVNTVDDVAALVDADRLAVLYPGDVWNISTVPSGTTDAIARYRADAAAVDSQPLTTHEPVEPASILAAARTTLAEIANAFPRWVRRRIPALCFAFTDGPGALRVDVGRASAELIETPDTECVVHASTQAIEYTFQHRWAIPTLLISGRFTIEGSEEHWDRFKRLGAAYASGFHAKGAVLGLRHARKRGFFFRRVPDVIDIFLPKARQALRR